MSETAESSITLGKDISLEEWLEIVLTHPDSRKLRVYPDCCFPTDEHRDQYIESIKSRSSKELRTLLRQFLISTGTLGCDFTNINSAIQSNSEYALKYEPKRQKSDCTLNVYL